MLKQTFLISLEGSPCTFKSSIINMLHKKYVKYLGKVLFEEEPLYDMTYITTNSKTVNSFEMFNKQPQSFAETLQNHIINCVTKTNFNLFNSNKYKKAKIVVMERNINSSLAFIQQYHKNKLLTEIQVNVLVQRIQDINKICGFPDINEQIYLYIPPEIGVKLIKSRGRIGEIEYITEKYLKQLHEIQMSLFKDVYTCTNDLSYICSIINKHLNLTQDEINNLPDIHDIRTNHVSLNNIIY